MKDKQWKPYYNSIHYICETTLRYDHKFNAEWPKGSYDFIGSDSKGLIYASYDKKDSTPQEIKEFLEKNFGFDLKLVRDKKNSIFGETIHTQSQMALFKKRGS